MSIAEHKYIDTQFVYGPPPLGEHVSTDGIFSRFTLVPQGYTDGTRIGDKMTGTSLQLKICQYTPGIADSTQTIVWFRVIIFIWKDDTQPEIEDILQKGTGDMAVFPHLWPFNHDKKVKRKLIFDQTYSQYADCSPTDTTYTGCQDPNIFINKYIPLRKYGSLATVNFQGGIGTGVNHIYLLLLNNVDPENSSSAWNTAVYTRYNFVDM